MILSNKRFFKDDSWIYERGMETPNNIYFVKFDGDKIHAVKFDRRMDKISDGDDAFLSLMEDYTNEIFSFISNKLSNKFGSSK